MKFRQLKLTCSNHEEENGRTAQVVAAVDSLGTIYNPPYTYQWQVSPLHIAPGDPTWAIGLEAYKYYYIKVTDGRGCTQKDSVSLRAYPNPLVEISTDPGDTVYLQNPHEIYSFENLSEDTLDISNFYWILNQQYNITSTENEPRFTYVEVGDYTTELKVYNPQGCDTSYYKSIRVEPVKLKIPNVFTPNGDGTNDYFIISLESGSDSPSGNKGTRDQHYEYEDYEPLNRYYESSELTIFNRWGRIVYHSKDYQNDWDGDNLPDGTYFYVLKCHGLKNDATYNGSVMIVKARRGD
jgi:PKD repeat protein